MIDRAGMFDRILASLHEVALVLGLALPPGTEAAWARTTLRLAGNTGWSMRGERHKTEVRR